MFYEEIFVFYSANYGYRSRFFAGANAAHYWWTSTSDDEESNQLKDQICKKHGLTLIDKNHNVYGEKRAVEIKSKTIHTMNKIGF